MVDSIPVHTGARARECFAREPLDPWWTCCAALEHDSNRVIAQRIRDWAYAWVRRSAQPGAESIDSTAMFIGTLAEQAWYLRNHLSENEEDRTFELKALLVAAAAVHAIDPDGSLLRFAIRELQARDESW
jgi:hypothetical protein